MFSNVRFDWVKVQDPCGTCKHRVRQFTSILKVFKNSGFFRLNVAQITSLVTSLTPPISDSYLPQTANTRCYRSDSFLCPSWPWDPVKETTWRLFNCTKYNTKKSEVKSSGCNEMEKAMLVGTLLTPQPVAHFILGRTEGNINTQGRTWL